MVVIVREMRIDAGLIEAITYKGRRPRGWILPVKVAPYRMPILANVFPEWLYGFHALGRKSDQSSVDPFRRATPPDPFPPYDVDQCTGNRHGSRSPHTKSDS